MKRQFVVHQPMNTICQWSMMKKHLQPKFGGNRFMGAQIRLHEYLISPIEIGVKLAWFITVPNSYEPGQFTLFSMGLIRVFMQPYLRPSWTDSCQIWCVRLLHHVLLKYGNKMLKYKKSKFDEVRLIGAVPLLKRSCGNTWVGEHELQVLTS